MLIDDEPALKEWLVATLEPMCDAEPQALARYVLALITKDKPLEKLRENCIDRLDVFLDRATKEFVDQLFDVIRTRGYIPEAKKENVQPKPSESSDDKSGESAELLEPQNSSSPARQEPEDSEQNPTNISGPSSSEPVTTSEYQPSGTVIQPVKRRYPHRPSSARHHSPNPRWHVNTSTGGANRHQGSSHYRPSSSSNTNNQRSHRSSSRSRSASPPPAKRSQRSYSHSSTGSSSRSSPSRSSPSRPPHIIHPPSTTNTDFLYKKNPCSDFFENKSYGVLGDSSTYDHGNNAVVFEQQQQQPPYYPTYPQYGMPPAHMHPHYREYNPENPELKRGPHQGPPMFLHHSQMLHHPRMHGPPMGNIPPNQQLVAQPSAMINQQRTLVTVVPNAEPLPLEPRMRPNETIPFMNNPNLPMIQHKRHGPNGPYPNDRRPQQHEPPPNHESHNNANSLNASQNNNHHHSNNGFNNRGWKRPWQKAEGSNSAPATLEIRKIPSEFNTISKLNEHFSKFGTVTNVQIAYDGSPDSALIAYATFNEAETAYKNPQPLFNNRFIKIFWHNSNKSQQNSANNNNNNNNQSSQSAQQQSQQSQSSLSAATNPTETSTTKKPSPYAPNPKKLHWMKAQQQSTNKVESSTVTNSSATDTSTTPTSTSTTPSERLPVVNPTAVTTRPIMTKKSTIISANIAKKEAAKKAAMEINRKKQGLLQEQIQQQKLLLKKFETSESTIEKESIRALMKQIDANIVTLKDSLRITPLSKSSTPIVNVSKVTKDKNISQQDLLKEREATLKKQIETLRAKTSADMRRAMSNTLGQTSIELASILPDSKQQSETNKDDSLTLNEQHDYQLLIKNIKDLPRNDLEEFLKQSGATKVEVSKTTDDNLLVTINTQSNMEKIKKNGLRFRDQRLELSFQEETSLNLSGKKRTLSETLEDELLGGTSTDTTQHDQQDEEDYEPSPKRPNQSQTSENEETNENDDEDRLLADDENQIKDSNPSVSFDDESNLIDEDERNVLDNDELQLLDL